VILDLLDVRPLASASLLTDPHGESHPMKFTIRDLFLVTMIVALALAWGVDHWKTHRRLKQVEDALKVVDWQVNENGELDRDTLPHAIRDLSDSEYRKLVPDPPNWRPTDLPKP